MSVANNLPTFFKKPLFHDCVIVLPGRTVPAHRVILAASSSYFHAAFTNGMQESTNDTIVLEDIDEKAALTVIYWCYKLKLPAISWDSMDDLLQVIKVADRLCCETMLSSLCSALSRNLGYTTEDVDENIEELLYTLDFVKSNSLPPLQDVVHGFLATNWCTFCDVPAIKEWLSHADRDTILDILVRCH
jgi:hypothetical protein